MIACWQTISRTHTYNILLLHERDMYPISDIRVNLQVWEEVYEKGKLDYFFLNQKVMSVSSICTTNLIFNWINDVWARIFLPTHIAFDEVSHIFILKKKTSLKTLFRVLIFMTFCNKKIFFFILLDICDLFTYSISMIFALVDYCECYN